MVIRVDLVIVHHCSCRCNSHGYVCVVFESFVRTGADAIDLQ